MDAPAPAWEGDGDSGRILVWPAEKRKVVGLEMGVGKSDGEGVKFRDSLRNGRERCCQMGSCAGLGAEYKQGGVVSRRGGSDVIEGEEGWEHSSRRKR